MENRMYVFGGERYEAWRCSFVQGKEKEYAFWKIKDIKDMGFLSKERKWKVILS